jgi:hypothetical protein
MGTANMGTTNMGRTNMGTLFKEANGRVNGRTLGRYLRPKLA